MQQWEIQAGGVPCTIVAQEGAGGKLFVRCNGRLVMQPFAPEELERTFTLNGDQFRLVRTEGGLELEMLPRAFVESIELEPAPTFGMTPAARAWTYFGVALFVFLVSSCATVHTTRLRRAGLRALEQSVTNWTPDLARATDRGQLIGKLVSSGFAWQALFAATGAIGAWFLARGERWAQRLLVIVTWLMPAFLLFTFLRVDRLLHVQFYSGYDLSEAQALISRNHTIGLVVFVITALGAGALLQLVRREVTLPESDAAS